MVRTLLLALSLSGLLAGSAAAAEDCASCNSLSNVAACCRPKAGCQTRAQDGQNVCVATARSREAEHNGFTPVQCKKNYNSCVKSVRAGSGRVRGAAGAEGPRATTDKAKRDAAATALKDGRKSCQKRLDVCLSQAKR